MRHKTLKWFEAPVGGIRIPVYLSCRELDDDLEHCVGVTLGDSQPRCVMIDVEPPREDQNVTLLHELLHCSLWFKSGLHHATEERLVQAMAWALRDITLWPRRPVGVIALERFARKVPR